MVVKYEGVVIVPVDVKLAKAFRTICKNAYTLNRYLPLISVEETEHGEKVSVLSTYLPSLTPEDLVDDKVKFSDYNFKLFVLDTSEGRKIVLRWEDKTIPVMDWDALPEDIDAYREVLDSAVESFEYKIQHGKSKYHKKRWRESIEGIDSWRDILEEAELFRDKLCDLAKSGVDESIRYSAKVHECDKIKDGLKFLERENPRLHDKNHNCRKLKPSVRGIKYKEPKFNLRGSLRDIHVVGSKYYYKDLRVCSVGTGVSDLRVYANACLRQSGIAKKKYRVTGATADRDYATEKELKGKINGSLIFMMIKMTKGRREAAASEALLQDLSCRLGLSREAVAPLWEASSLKAYREFRELNGYWRPPQTVEELLAQDVNTFDKILAKYKCKILEFRETEPYRLVEREYEEYYVEDHNRISSEILECYLPVEEVYKSADHIDYYRRKEIAEVYYSQGVKVLR